MNFVKLDTSLFPIVYLDYPNNQEDCKSSKKDNGSLQKNKF